MEYYGHPLADVLRLEQQKMSSREDFLRKYNLNDKPIIALLPGSRIQELTYILPVMMQVIQYFPNYQFVIAATSSLPKNLYEAESKGHPVTIITNDTYSIMHHAHVGLIKSGTSSIEAALFKLPHVVCYLGNGTSFYIAKKLVSVKYVSLVNIILDRLVLTELLQQDFTIPKIVEELKAIATGPKRNEVLNDYNILIGLLQDENISTKIATSIYTRLQKT